MTVMHIDDFELPDHPRWRRRDIRDGQITKRTKAEHVVRAILAQNGAWFTVEDIRRALNYLATDGTVLEVLRQLEKCGWTFDSAPSGRGRGKQRRLTAIDGADVPEIVGWKPPEPREVISIGPALGWQQAAHEASSEQHGVQTEEQVTWARFVLGGRYHLIGMWIDEDALVFTFRDETGKLVDLRSSPEEKP